MPGPWLPPSRPDFAHGNLPQTESDIQIHQTSLWKHAMCIMVQWCCRTAHRQGGFNSERWEEPGGAWEHSDGKCECRQLMLQHTWCRHPKATLEEPTTKSQHRVEAPAKDESKCARSITDQHQRAPEAATTHANVSNMSLPYKMPQARSSPAQPTIELLCNAHKSCSISIVILTFSAVITFPAR